MRRFGAYIFFLTLVIHSLSQILIIGNYLFNKEFIASELCENKEEPQLECNGKCYLKKELKKDKERKQEEKTSKIEVLLFCECKVIEVHSPIDFTVEKTEYSAYLNRLNCGYEKDIFHPPC